MSLFEAFLIQRLKSKRLVLSFDLHSLKSFFYITAIEAEAADRDVLRWRRFPPAPLIKQLGQR